MNTKLYRTIAWLLRIVLGGIFIYASLDKILHPAAFAEIIYNYQVLPGEIINVSAIVLPWLELVLGILLVFGKFLPGASVLCALLLAAFWATLLFNLARGLDVHCGCFSTQSTDQAPMVWYVFRDTTFLAIGLALIVLVFKQNRAHVSEVK